MIAGSAYVLKMIMGRIHIQPKFPLSWGFQQATTQIINCFSSILVMVNLKFKQGQHFIFTCISIATFHPLFFFGNSKTINCKFYFPFRILTFAPLFFLRLLILKLSKNAGHWLQDWFKKKSCEIYILWLKTHFHHTGLPPKKIVKFIFLDILN